MADSAAPAAASTPEGGASSRVVSFAAPAPAASAPAHHHGGHHAAAHSGHGHGHGHGSGHASPTLGAWAMPSPLLKRARSTSATPAESAAEELERLRRDNQLLREELDTMEAQLYAFSHTDAATGEPISPHAGTSHGADAALPTSHPMLSRKISLLPSGKEVRISAVEMAAMRAIYCLFDKDNTGVSAGELRALHEKLGEPITEEEAAEAVRDIGGGRDAIDFESFCLYWDGVHPSQRGSSSGGASGGAGGALSRSGTEVTSGGAGSSSSGVVAPVGRRHRSLEERDKKRRWYQARFKFVMAKVSNPAVGRIYVETSGVFPSLEFRVRFYTDTEAGEKVEISPWHDVPYRNPDGTYNMICEIPKWSRRKFEIATTEEYNPIKQDVKNGTLREYTYGDMLFNYGAVPQTWENPKFVSPETGTIGDNDPIDIVDIGAKMWSTGSIVAVKVLGVLGMIDSGETDWKLIGINISDPLAPLLNDIDDVKVHMPGAVEALHHWLRHYKMPTLNEFAFGGEARQRAYAEKLIEETHGEWVKLTEERGSRAVVDKH